MMLKGQRSLTGLIICVIALTGVAQQPVKHSQLQQWQPLQTRVDIQTDTVTAGQIIDGQWVAVGLQREYAISRNIGLLPHKVAAYRFELREEDNILEGLYPGEKVARAELSYCYGVSSDYSSRDEYLAARRRRTVHYLGKGACSQASHMKYSFKIFVPSTMNANACVIFAQWHSMPTRTVIADTNGRFYYPGDREFDLAERRMLFKKGKGFENGRPNGWISDHGGYPVMAFGFADKYFYIKANSDRKWITDVDERCDVDIMGSRVMVPLQTRYKASTIVSRLSYDQFPKDRWVEFSVDVVWTSFGAEAETVKQPGKLSVDMKWVDAGVNRALPLVQNAEILVGRNDKDGYYFKCGAYRTGGNRIPVCYYIAGYEEQKI